MDSNFPNDAECLTTEFRNAEMLDFFVEKIAVQDSQLSNSDKKIEINKTISEMRQDLTKIAQLCGTNVTQLIDSSRYHLEMTNVTGIDVQNCFMKYVADNDFLPSKYINRNWYFNVTANVDCEAAVVKQVDNVKRSTNHDLTNPVECILASYKRNRVYDSWILSVVLYRIELPQEINDAEMEKVSRRLTSFEADADSCNESRTASLEYI